MGKVDPSGEWAWKVMWDTHVTKPGARADAVFHFCVGALSALVPGLLRAVVGSTTLTPVGGLVLFVGGVYNGVKKAGRDALKAGDVVCYEFSSVAFRLPWSCHPNAGYTHRVLRRMTLWRYEFGRMQIKKQIRLGDVWVKWPAYRAIPVVPLRPWLWKCTFY